MTRTVEEFGINDAYDHEIMTAFCYTLENIGLAPYGLDILEFEHVALDGHYASAIFHFYHREELFGYCLIK